MASEIDQPSVRPSLVPKGINLAASWYIALASADLAAKPRALELFGRPLVAWRDGQGRPVIMPRYCPHMGASLALGKVVDGSLQCPFHHWRFAGSGQCVEVPGIDRIPAIAKQATYPVVERYDYIWIWYGSPTPMFALPEFPALEADRSDYMVFRFSDFTTGTVRRVLENAYDYYHFLTLHGLEVWPMQLTFLSDQHAAHDNGPPIAADAWLGALIEGTMVKLDPLTNPIRSLRSAAGAFGKGDKFSLLVDGWPGGQRFTVYIDGREVHKVLLGITPIAENQTIQQGWAAVKKTGSVWRNILHCLLFYGQNRAGTMQDLPIYNTTKPDGNDIYVEYDRSLLKFRQYYQSWVDRAAKDA
jgi:phenylpropionate dioxygenase-like ring-hydroxylating dioxygenase large terminal subunit